MAHTLTSKSEKGTEGKRTKATSTNKRHSTGNDDGREVRHIHNNNNSKKKKYGRKVSSICFLLFGIVIQFINLHLMLTTRTQMKQSLFIRMLEQQQQQYHQQHQQRQYPHQESRQHQLDGDFSVVVLQTEDDDHDIDVPSLKNNSFSESNKSKNKYNNDNHTSTAPKTISRKRFFIPWILQNITSKPHDDKNREDGIMNNNTFLSNQLSISSSSSSYFLEYPNERFDTLLELGSHFLTTRTGCRISKWIFPTGGSSHKTNKTTTNSHKKQYHDCYGKEFQSKRLLKHKLDTNQLQTNDTIYVTFTKLEEFVMTSLSKIHVDVVIISGQIQMTSPVDEVYIEQLLSHQHIMHWFCQNLSLYANNGSTTSHGKDIIKRYSNKVSPFPYGLKEVAHKERANEPLVAYKKVFFETLEMDNINDVHDDGDDGDRRRATFANSSMGLSPKKKNKKTQLIYSGYLRSLPNRKDIPMTSSQRIDPTTYFRQMSNAVYVVSPNGDRPECYRHYEAIGLGVIPITELDPNYFYHLIHGPVIYGANFSAIDDGYGKKIGILDEFEKKLALRSASSDFPMDAETDTSRYANDESGLYYHYHRGMMEVNRNLIFEEYWIDYVDSVVGRRLNWWNVERNHPSTLDEIIWGEATDMIKQNRKKKPEQKTQQ